MEEPRLVDLEQSRVVSQIISDLENEELDKQDVLKKSSEHNLVDIPQHLGIYMNREGLSSPKYGRAKGKRGRRSLKELREADGHCREQQKIDNLLNIGKWKYLPKAP